MTDLTDRINATIRHAQGRIERATFKIEHDEWREVLRLLEDIRDQIGRPAIVVTDAMITDSLQEAMPSRRGPGRPRKEPQPPEAA